MNKKYFELINKIVVPEEISMDQFIRNIANVQSEVEEVLGVEILHLNKVKLEQALFNDGFITDAEYTCGVSEANQRYILLNYYDLLFYKNNNIYLRGIADFLGNDLTEKDIFNWLYYRRYMGSYENPLGKDNSTLSLRSCDSIKLCNALKYFQKNLDDILKFRDEYSKYVTASSKNTAE